MGEEQDEEGQSGLQAAGENTGCKAVTLVATEMSLILWGCTCVSSQANGSMIP